MQTKSDIHIRPASLEDLDFIISLIPRLIEFGPPSWRNKNEMVNVDTKILADKLTSQPEGTAIFIALNNKGTPLGFIHLHPGNDHYNKDKHGHISDIIVAPEGKGKGIGRMLMEKAEDWARSLDYRWLTLSVFAQNSHAREVYEQFGYGQDILKYVKELKK